MAFVENGKLKRIAGVKTKELMLWLSVVEVYVDESSSPGKITFKTGTGLSDSFDVSAFELGMLISAAVSICFGSIETKLIIVTKQILDSRSCHKFSLKTIMLAKFFTGSSHYNDHKTFDYLDKELVGEV
uniref:Uncharacterized protein n=1 Tax=Oryza brachyantha TaxID=4533 RepID=J3N9E3_ORYBR